MNDTPQKSDYSQTLKWGLFIIIVGAILAIVLHFAGVFTSAATAPGRVINKTLGTDNMIHSYEWFFDTNAQFNARRNQIKGHNQLATVTTDPHENIRLNIELLAMRQSCREMAESYNANATKVNKAVFKSRNLPDFLSSADCEF